MRIQLKAMTLAEEDFQLYGPIGRDDDSLAARARSMITQMEQSLPTPETILTDDNEKFALLFVEAYKTIYKGLLVLYTGVVEELRVASDPRYSSLATFKSEGQAIPFLGHMELTQLLRAHIEANTTTDFSIQVRDKESPIKLCLVLTYQAQGSTITKMEFIGDCDEKHANRILHGLDLPVGAS